MRLMLISLGLLLIAGCAAQPKPAATPAVPVATAIPRERGDLVGLDANALVTRFGTPRLQVREGDGTKLQFTAGSCVLDAYLYPGARGGVPRVAHVDTRNRDGRPVPQSVCLALLDAS